MTAEIPQTLEGARAERVTLDRSALLTYGALGLLLLFHLWGNLYWIQQNVVLVGRDAGSHLNRVLQYVPVFDRLSVQSLFEALTHHGFRPPLLYMLSLIPYHLLGHTMDALQMTNVVLLMAMLGLTFFLGRRIIGHAGGALLATLCLGLFPMTAAMTRLFYLENIQTTLVLIVLAALLLGERYAQRRWALVWGITIGLGMLAKWAMPAYVVVPSLVLAWQGGIPQAQWAALRQPKIAWGVLGRAFLGALLLALAFYLPNRAHALTLPTGDWLCVTWIVLLTPALYALQRPSSPLTNFWAGACLGLAVASVWYIGRIDFLAPLLDSAYGTYGGNYAAYSPWRLSNYTRNPRYLVTHAIGLLPALVLLPAGLWPWLRRWREWRSAQVGSWLLWGSILSMYIFTATTSQDAERNSAAILPAFAILCAAGLWHYRRPVRLGLAAVAVGALLLQWSLYTFDSLAPFHARTAPLWATGEFLQRPASGQTDPSFWVAPDVLQTIRAAHDPAVGPESILGMLVNSLEIHRSPFNFLIDTQYPEVDLITLTEKENLDAWPRAARSEWLLTKNGDNHDVDPPALRIIDEVYGNPDGLFHLLFAPVREYPLANGEQATLWRRTDGPRYLPKLPEGLVPLGETLRGWAQGKTILVSEPEQALWLGLMDLLPDQAGLLAGAEPEAPTVFALLRGPAAADPASTAWLDANLYRAYDGWFDTEFLVIWGRPTHPMTTTPLAQQLGEARLGEVHTVGTVTAGNVVPLELRWDETGAVPLKVSARLVNGAGEVVAQLDRDLQPGMRLGLFVPPATPPGDYQLAISLYDPATLAPVAAPDGATLVPLGPVTVTAP